MAFVSGVAGDISIGATALKVKSWEGNLEQEMIDVTRKGDGGWRNKVTGLRQMTGSFSADFDTAINATGSLPFPFGSTAANITLSMDDGNNDGGAFTFSGFIASLSFTSPVEGVVSISGNYESTGAVTYTGP